MFNRRQFLGSSATVSIASLLPTVSLQAKEVRWDSQTDILIAGGGAAGCMAAIEAAKSGKKILLVQATAMLGGSSAISSGWIRCCGTRWHAVHHIKDTTAAYEEDILRYGNGCRLPAKARKIAQLSGPFVNYLMDIGVEFTEEEDRANGGEQLRIVKTQGAGGTLMQKLSQQVQQTSGVAIAVNTRIIEVITSENGSKVIGAVLESKKKRKTVSCKSIILATGGYGRNQELVERFTNSWAKTGRIMDIGDKGDGLLIASNLGAGTANLNIGMVCPTLEVTRNIFYSSAPLLNGGILVNERGRRFTNEYVIYTQTNIDMLKQKKVWEVISLEMHPATIEKMMSAGVARKCTSYEKLAQLIGCPVEGLKADIEEHNAITRQAPSERHDRFGRTVYNKELTAPFYALEVKPVMIETVGGITINENAQVTTLLGRPLVKGLYAAGAVAFGEHFGTGYRSGEAYVYAGVTGMIAGQEAAKIA